MRQYSTGLARSASGRTTKEPERVALAGAPPGEVVAPLHGVMTGLANLVNEHLGHLTIGPQATRFLRQLERQTFGNAGLHRRAGRQDPGLWCPYVHTVWAEALPLSSSALTHLRTRLVEAGIIWYTPDPHRQGEGAVGWSFDFASWRPPRWGGARAGAGRPRAASSVGKVAPVADLQRAEPTAAPRRAQDEAPTVPMERRSVRSLPPSGNTGPRSIRPSESTIQDVNAGAVAERSGEFKMSTNAIQDVIETTSRRQQAQIKMSTARAAETGSHQVSGTRARNYSLKKEQNQRRRTDADASGVTSTPQVASEASGLSLISLTHAPQAERSHHTSIPSRAQPPSAAKHGARTGTTRDPLPSPLPYETVRSYWLRLYREACAATGTEARDLVHAAARALLNMGHERTDYILLAQLRQAAGTWATVLHWLIECAGRELADPRTYLRAIAARQRIDQSEQSRPRRSRLEMAPMGQRADLHDGGRILGGLDPPAVLADPGRLNACRSDGAVDRGRSPTSSLAVAEHDRSYHRQAPDDRQMDYGSAVDDEVTPGATLNEHETLAGVVPDGAADGAAASRCVPMAHVWHVAQQRLCADLTPAQYSSWLAHTQLYRTSEGSLALVTRTTFAAELIGRRWGERIQWILSQITGRRYLLIVTPRLEGAGPAG